jgi:UDP-N-acetylglucosamine--N-acetylmuramyl-(pentapeptide) pyrophosphoryl-undecaprenol N-acetylglucosamine transferase
MASANPTTKSPKAPRVLIASGGSGGHLFPALAIAEKLRDMGFVVSFIGYGGAFTNLVTERGFEFMLIPAAKWNVKNPIRKLWALVTLGRALLKAMRLVYRTQPAVVLGTGGYATVAAVAAAKISGVPTLVQEQNVLPGRANRFLFKYVDKVLLAFEETRSLVSIPSDKTVVAGNPVRKEVVAAKNLPRVEDGKFHILITGGSQASRILSEVVPTALTMLSEGHRRRLSVVHQARVEDMAEVTSAYQAAGITAEVKSFFTDLPARLRWCHVYIGRAGCSSVIEAGMLERASIFIPGEFADRHQVYNAKVLADKDAAVMIEEPKLTASLLAGEVQKLMDTPEWLLGMQERARAAIPDVDAAQIAADVVAHMAKTDILQMLDQEPPAP